MGYKKICERTVAERVEKFEVAADRVQRPVRDSHLALILFARFISRLFKTIDFGIHDHTLALPDDIERNDKVVDIILPKCPKEFFTDGKHSPIGAHT